MPFDKTKVQTETGEFFNLIKITSKKVIRKESMCVLTFEPNSIGIRELVPVETIRHVDGMKYQTEWVLLFKVFVDQIDKMMAELSNSGVVTKY